MGEGTEQGCDWQCPPLEEAHCRASSPLLWCFLVAAAAPVGCSSSSFGTTAPTAAWQHRIGRPTNRSGLVWYVSNIQVVCHFGHQISTPERISTSD